MADTPEHERPVQQEQQHEQQPDLASLRRSAELMATRGADLVRARRLDAAEPEVAGRKTSAVDIVTVVDQEAEALLRDLVHEHHPDDGFLGEEGARSTSSTGRTWVIDPIDGTVNFLYGVPHYAVSVAVVDDQHHSLAGAVVDVVTGDVYSAHLGGGATCNGAQLRARPAPPMAERLFLTGFGYDPAVRRLQGAAVARLVEQVRDIRRLGSAALDLCSLAAGRADAYVEEGLQLWDRAAAGLVAAEAGVRVELHRGVAGSECTVAAADEGFREVLETVRSCGFLDDQDV